jgi:polysaccharide export outer membrane protein
MKSPETSTIQGIQVVTLDREAAQYVRPLPAPPGFAETFGQTIPTAMIVGKGDVLSIVVWEAPPAVLFATAATPSPLEVGRATGPFDYLVDASGTINVPYAGSIQVVGRDLASIEKEIVARLRNKAHLPQVTARIIQNAASTVSVVGEVQQSKVMPLTPRGERVLDAIAVGGGTKQAADKISVQITREGRSVLMPLQNVIRDPQQNIVLRAGDVVTALYQPLSFTVLGASGTNAEIPFEATGLTLSQALGRASGLNQADPKGVFLFRWERPSEKFERPVGVAMDAEGRVPVIYRINLKDPSLYFVMQNFPVRDRDVIYIANSPVSEFQRFVSLLVSTILPAISIDNALK